MARRNPDPVKRAIRKLRKEKRGESLIQQYVSAKRKLSRNSLARGIPCKSVSIRRVNGRYVVRIKR